VSLEFQAMRVELARQMSRLPLRAVAVVANELRLLSNERLEKFSVVG
jgi:hypothetical protein